MNLRYQLRGEWKNNILDQLWIINTHISTPHKVFSSEIPEKKATEDWQDQRWNSDTTRMSNIHRMPATKTKRMKPLFQMIFIV